MSTWIDVSFGEVIRTTPAGDRAVLDAIATSSGNIPTEVFTHRVVDDGFSHVSTTTDLKTLPTTPEQATAADLAYYRKARMEIVRSSPRLAKEAKDEIAGRIRLLVKLWDRDQNVSFGGDTSQLYSSDDP